MAENSSDILWIFDRTINDILNDTEKNYINYNDLNRIEQRMLELTTQLNNYKYVNHIVTKTDWVKQNSTNDTSNIPLKQHLNRIRDNLKELINSYYVYPTTPNPLDTLEDLTIYKANDLEKILYDLHLLIKNMEKDFKLCGQLYCGGVDT